jgi:hypothetical protein
MEIETKLDLSRFFPSVLQVVPTDDYKIYSYFNDGSVRLFDVKPLIKPDTVFEPLSDINFFKSKATVMNGTAAWDIAGNYDESACVELDPLVLFNTPMINDPLEKES